MLILRFLSAAWIACFLVSSVSYGTDRKEEDEESIVSALSSRRSSLVSSFDPSQIVQGIDEITGLYYSGGKFQEHFLPDTYVKDEILDPILQAALKEQIDASFTEGVNIVSQGSRQFSLNQQRRILSPLFYLVRIELEGNNNPNILYHHLSQHMQRVWRQDHVLRSINLEAIVSSMRPFASTFLNIGRIEKLTLEIQLLRERKIYDTQGLDTLLYRNIILKKGLPVVQEVIQELRAERDQASEAMSVAEERINSLQREVSRGEEIRAEALRSAQEQIQDYSRQLQQARSDIDRLTKEVQQARLSPVRTNQGHGAGRGLQVQEEHVPLLVHQDHESQSRCCCTVQ